MKTLHLSVLALVFIAAGQIPAFAQTTADEDKPRPDPYIQKEFNTPDKSMAGKKFSWVGTWKYNSRYDPVTVTISKVSASGFHFNIDAMEGANMGDISGTARIKGSKALFDDRLTKAKDADKYGCRLLFINHGASLQLEESESECSHYAGAGVTFARGKLLRGNPPVLEKNFVDIGVFRDLASDRKFKALVGVKDYEEMLDDFQQSGEKDDEELNAKAYAGCVRGICPWNTAIVITDGKGHFWAAVNILFDKPDTGAVHYYTNVPAWAGKLPKAIQEWHESASNYPVVYKNKPRAAVKR